MYSGFSLEVLRVLVLSGSFHRMGRLQYASNVSIPEHNLPDDTVESPRQLDMVIKDDAFGRQGILSEGLHLC